MRDTARGVLEGLASAFVSSDLTVRTEGRRGDVDYIAALGMAGARLRSGASSLAALTLAQDHASLKDALHYVLAITRHLNVKRGWKLRHRELRHVAEEALAYAMEPACPACHGRKYRKMDGAPILSATVCPKCHGSGLRPIPLRHGRAIAEVTYAIADTNKVIEAAVRNRLR